MFSSPLGNWVGPRAPSGNLVANWLKIRLASASLAGEPCTRSLVHKLLEYALEFGCPNLSGGALDILTFLRETVGYEFPKAPPSRITIGPLQWLLDWGSSCPDETNFWVGRGTLFWDQKPWLMLDFRDQLQLLPALATPTNISDEIRQCMVIHVAAGLLYQQSGACPAHAEVQALALSIRKELYTLARIATVSLGPVGEYVTAAEASLRVSCHDATHRDHDKDFTCFASFPVTQLRHTDLQVVRVTAGGEITVDTIIGSDRLHPHTDVWLLIFDGHMRLLVPGADHVKTAPNTISRSDGWRDCLENSDDQTALSAHSLLYCPHCGPTRASEPRPRQSRQAVQRVHLPPRMMPWLQTQIDQATQPLAMWPPCSLTVSTMQRDRESDFWAASNLVYPVDRADPDHWQVWRVPVLAPAVHAGVENEERGGPRHRFHRSRGDSIGFRDHRFRFARTSGTSTGLMGRLYSKIRP